MPSNKLMKVKPGQNWRHWLLMAEGTLIGVCQMVWQTPEERDSIRDLYSKVMGKPAFKPQSWDQQMRWSAVALLAFSAEQAMKAIAIRSSQSGEFLSGHKLKDLWDHLGSTDRKRIVGLAQKLRVRASGTALGNGPPIRSVKDLEAVISEHDRTFVDARYRETIVGLLPSTGLWNLAMALVAYLRELLDEESAQVSP